MDDMNELNYFLGLKVERSLKEGTLTINQTQYVSALLKRFGMIVDQCPHHWKSISSSRSTCQNQGRSQG